MSTTVEVDLTPITVEVNEGRVPCPDCDVVAEPPELDTAPTLSNDGANAVGYTLTTTDGIWSGTAPFTFAYQWTRGGSPISGATSSSYQLVLADVGAVITCQVTPTGPGGSASPGAATGVLALAAIAPANVILPQALGARGGTLTAQVGTWTGSPTLSYAYLWETSPSGEDTWSSAGTGSTYDDSATTDLDVRLTVTATGPGGSTPAVSTVRVGAVVATPAGWLRFNLDDATASYLPATYASRTGNTVTLQSPAATANPVDGPWWSAPLRDYRGDLFASPLVLSPNRVRAIAASLPSQVELVCGLLDTPDPRSGAPNGYAAAIRTVAGTYTILVYTWTGSPTPTQTISSVGDALDRGVDCSSNIWGHSLRAAGVTALKEDGSLGALLDRAQNLNQSFIASGTTWYRFAGVRWIGAGTGSPSIDVGAHHFVTALSGGLP